VPEQRVPERRDAVPSVPERREPELRAPEQCVRERAPEIGHRAPAIASGRAGDPVREFPGRRSAEGRLRGGDKHETTTTTTTTTFTFNIYIYI